MSLWMHMQFNKKLNLKLNPNKSILVVDLSIEIRNPDLESSFLSRYKVPNVWVIARQKHIL